MRILHLGEWPSAATQELRADYYTDYSLTDDVDTGDMLREHSIIEFDVINEITHFIPEQYCGRIFKAICGKICLPEKE